MRWQTVRLRGGWFRQCGKGGGSWLFAVAGVLREGRVGREHRDVFALEDRLWFQRLLCGLHDLCL